MPAVFLSRVLILAQALQTLHASFSRWALPPVPPGVFFMGLSAGSALAVLGCFHSLILPTKWNYFMILSDFLST